jgi:hypothetical protein
VRHISLFALLVLALVACDDPAFRIDPILVTDTVEVFAPTAENAGRPTALDITSRQFLIQGPRFPERSADAEQWDFAVRLRDGELTLVPASVVGLNSRAALAGPLAAQTFEEVREAPAATTFSMDSAVVMRQGQVYGARSRVTGGAFGGACTQFAKLQPLEVDAAAGRLLLRITTNERCSDLRLVEES